MIINFYIERKPKKSRTDQPIYLQITGLVKRHKFKLNTGERIQPNYWNHSKQRVKPSAPNSFELNKRLDGISKDVPALSAKLLSEKPNAGSDAIVKAVIEYFNPPPPKKKENQKSFFDYYDMYNDLRKNKVSKRTLLNFGVLKTHLKDFERFQKAPITFEGIDVLFIERFVQFLFDEKKHSNNTAYKLVIFLKTFLNWASIRKLNFNMDYKMFRTKLEDETEVIYLTDEELNTLLEANLSENPRLASIRDTFCFACLTSGRYSDVSKIQREDIRNGVWYLRTSKTKDCIEIPLLDDALEILERHKDEQRPIPSISNQKMNNYLKELCELLEIDQPIKTVRYRGSERIETTKPKYEYITTHTARRTFITLSLERGMRPETLMEITGHKDFKMLKKYIKITSRVKENELKKAWRKEPKLEVINTAYL